MGQQSLIYSFVARGTVILAEYTEFTGNFISIASQCLQKLPATNNKLTYNCDGHTFNYLAVGRQVPIAFLERIKEDFTGRYGGGKAATAVANSLNKEFGLYLKHSRVYAAIKPPTNEDVGLECCVMEVDEDDDHRRRETSCVHHPVNFQSNPRAQLPFFLQQKNMKSVREVKRK
ncbi:synptobrevin-related protein [Pyrus ussuriensis x Pyrus communis]|uniref:Synptobrevin-related protein n=1 Tax=Pyrus ussuriensis x Pyrus communis TaxID=2448454 RepID=A0A5N5FG71_9ROSA|nr:synptobrevin-related protein [Pyrus ussuriensis x Pyrus communis]